MNNWLKKNWKNLIVFVLYVIVLLFLLNYHENSRDEAQAWLLAKNCNIVELIRSNEI